MLRCVGFGCVFERGFAPAGDVDFDSWKMVSGKAEHEMKQCAPRVEAEKRKDLVDAQQI